MKVIKDIWKNIRNIKLKTLILLILFFMMSSYAWFIYVDKVSGGLSAHVTAWHVTFKVDDEEVRDLTLNVGQIYPGMDDFTQTITVINNGEIDGRITYDIKRMVVLGQVYEATNGVTYDDLKNMIAEDFPFSLDVSVEGVEDNTILVDEERNVTITVSWALDEDDELDTQWGEDAYEYYSENGSGSIPVVIEMQLKVEQKQN